MVGLVGMLVGLHCRVGDAWRKWSHMCSSWYFPRFLLKVGSCTRMNMASLMVLEWQLNLFVHYIELVGDHGMSCGDTVVVYGGGGP